LRVKKEIMLGFAMDMLVKGRFYTVAIIVLGLAAVQVFYADTGKPVVRAVLFTSPTCGHCAKVKEEVLPPLVERYGPQLQVVNINTRTQIGQEIFLSACMKHGLVNLSVPLLIVGNTALLGSVEIPERFPGLVEKNIAEGGIDWPGIPGLRTMLAANPAFSSDAPEEAEPPAEALAGAAPMPIAMETEPSSEPAAVPSSTTTEKSVESASSTPPAMAAAPAPKPLPASNSKTPEQASAGLSASNSAAPRSSAAPVAPLPANASAIAGSGSPPPTVKREPSGLIDLTAGEEEIGVAERIQRDLYGNILSILVLAGMILTLLASPVILRKSEVPANPGKAPHYDWLTPILTLAGLGVAGYLSHVEVQEVAAVCGPVGDCNTVQQSEWAKLFGILPIGVLGLLGFLAILAAWALRHWGSDRISHWAAVSILGMTAFGTLFSIYLTFLEPFVIGATCLWCLSSSVIMTALYVLALRPGRQAWSALARCYRLGPWPPFLQPIK
jgi:uncharacterized membrane protein